MIWYRWQFIDSYLLLKWCIFIWIQITAQDSYQYKRYEKGKVVPVSGYQYKVYNPNDNSNDGIDMVEYHVGTLPQFQDIAYKSGEKGNFGCLLSVRMNLEEFLVICLGQDEVILKHYIFIKNMWTHKGKFWIFPKDRGCGIIILNFQS